MRVLVTGGAGFVGSNLAIALAGGVPDEKCSPSTTCTAAARS